MRTASLRNPDYCAGAAAGPHGGTGRARPPHPAVTGPSPAATALAAAFLAGGWTRASLIARGRSALGFEPWRELTFERETPGHFTGAARHPSEPSPAAKRSADSFAPGLPAARSKWLPSLVDATLAAWPTPPCDQPRALAGWLSREESFVAHAHGLRPKRHFIAPLAMGENRWPVQPLPDVAALAHWLRLDVLELAAFADVQHRGGRVRTPTALRHYRVSTRIGASGSVRVLEAPKERLKELQRRIGRHILAHIPLHPAAHATPGHSVLDAARRHVSRPLVVLADCESFFASVTAGRVFGIFRSAGYAEPVAHLLTGLCKTSLPADVWRTVPKPSEPRRHDAHARLGRRLTSGHLPQGAPTSPMLANLAAWTLDLRLAGLARSWGVTYTRYVDDLIFSGRSFVGGRSATGLLAQVGGIAAAEGFTINAAKSRTRSRAQRQQVLGVVVNAHPAVARDELDQLRAVLHNCASLGAASQNREGHADFRAHLLGRISWVAHLHPGRGAQLRAAFDRIGWD